MITTACELHRFEIEPDLCSLGRIESNTNSLTNPLKNAVERSLSGIKLPVDGIPDLPAIYLY
jgi:hypothetical protein